MRTQRHPLPLTAALTAVFVLLSATSAMAHPFITDGATLPAASLKTMTLEMGHGCGNEAEGGGDPTLEVAMQVPEQVSFIEPLDTDGYDAGVETGDDGNIEVVTWTATEGGVAAPAVPMNIVVEGAEDDEVYFKVFQGCGDFEYRWVGTPDEPADDPAILLTLEAPDPSAPPPVSEPQQAPDDGSADEAPNDDDPEQAPDEASVEEAPTDDGTEAASDDDGPAAAPTDDSEATETPNPGGDEGGSANEDTNVADDQSMAASGESASAAPLWIGIGIVALIALGIFMWVVARQRRNRPADATE